MIQGLDVFRDFFAGYEDRYTLIGGVACYLNLAEADLDFRATKDFDIVLSAEALDSDFVNRFWMFIKRGGYEHQQKGSGEKQFYRFSKPVDKTWPYMLELFSRQPDGIFLAGEPELIPIPVNDDTTSLSAILLDDDYYHCVQEGKLIVQGVPILSVEYIIPFKMRAFCDLSLRKIRDNNVDSKHIKKHKNDILRISRLLSPLHTVNVTEKIRQHMRECILAIKDDPVQMDDLGLTGITLLQILNLHNRIYGLKLDV